MQRSYLPHRYFSVPDLLILLLLGTVIYGVVAIGNEWRAEFHPVTEISLSGWALPYYTLLSGIRGFVAYFISLAFTLVMGYAAGKSRPAERIIVPLLDILQSIPVLGFLPGLVLGLIALFPRTNTGLELACIVMIFTGQVWNMTFSFYSSMKSIPSDLQEASTVMGLSWRERLLRLELPFSAVGLAWNSLMAMAGGWFFLSACESQTLGDREFRLPGIGSYMAVAANEGNTRAEVYGIIAMVLLIVGTDFLIWRPILAWTQRFRLEETPDSTPVEPLMQIIIRESRLVRWVKVMFRERQFRQRRAQESRRLAGLAADPVSPAASGEVPGVMPSLPELRTSLGKRLQSAAVVKTLEIVLGLLVMVSIIWGSWKLIAILREVTLATWILLIRNTFWTFLRVLASLILSTLWAVPAGIWIGTSQKRIRIAQPIIQVFASFPAPMLYPLVLPLFFNLGINLDLGSMFLMLLGVQWYVLFNVLAGALRIPQELKYALDLMQSSRFDRWRRLYIPSVFPALVTGWITAAGGAWNASIVAEWVAFRGNVYQTGGLGATIHVATDTGNFPLLAASLTVMVGVVLILNRGFWAKVYHLAQTRFRLDM